MKQIYNLLIAGLFGFAAHAQCTTPSLSNVTGPDPICSGTSATLSATTDGETIVWFTAATGGTQAGTGATFVTPPLSGTTSYWAEAQNSNGIPATPISGGGKLAPTTTGGTTVAAASDPWGLAFTANSDFVLNSVDVFLTSSTSGNVLLYLKDASYNTLQTLIVPVPAGGTNSNPVQYTLPLNLTIIGGNSYKLVAESGPAMIRDSAAGGFPYAIGTVGTITGGTINNANTNFTSYYFFYNWNFTPGSPPCTSARQQVSVTVNPTPAAPTASAQTFCGSGTVAGLVANGTGLKWYNASTGGTQLTADTELATGNYYVSQLNATCESARTVVAVNVNAIPDAPTASPQVYCAPVTVAALQANGTGLKWYADAIGGTELTGTVALSSGTYYVSQTVSTCESARTSVSLTVNPTPDAPLASAQSFCGSGTIADLTATGTGLKWYNALTGGTELTSDTALASNTYYVAQSTATCESVRTAVLVTVNPIPDTPQADAQSYCGSVTVAELQANGTALKWYGNSTGGTELSGTTELAGGTYYVSQTVATCESARTPVTITVNEIPAAPVANAQLFCGDANVGDLSPNGGPLLWYTSETDPPLSPNTQLVTGTYYVQTTVNGCFSEFTSVSVTVNPTPEAPDGPDQQTVNEGDTIADLIVDGENLNWYADGAMTVELPETTVLEDGTTYYVMQTVDGCPSPLLGINVSVILGSNEAQMAAFTFYPNPVENTFTIINSLPISSVEVYNLLGQSIFGKSNESETITLDFSSLAEGTYIVKVQSGGAVKNIRIAKR